MVGIKVGSTLWLSRHVSPTWWANW